MPSLASRCLKCLLAFSLAPSAFSQPKESSTTTQPPAAPALVPKENLTQEPRPGFVSISTLTDALLLILNNPEPLSKPGRGSEIPGFFPREAFLILKRLPQPDTYYDELTLQYFADLQRLKKASSELGRVTLAGFSPGFCKWKTIGSEYNHIAYWSCYNSSLKIKSENAKAPLLMTIKIRTIINWGEQWFVTHLGKAHSTSAP